MNSFDLMLKLSLEQSVSDFLAGDSKADSVPENLLPLGNVAFFKESAWKNSDFYIKPARFRAAHPGLSLSSSNLKIAFGTSKLDNRDWSDSSLFLVNRNQCKILSRDVVFLLKSVAPLSLFDIDYRLDDSAKLSLDALKELKKRLAK